MNDCKHEDIMMNGALCLECKEVVRLIDLQAKVERLEQRLGRADSMIDAIGERTEETFNLLVISQYRIHNEQAKAEGGEA